MSSVEIKEITFRRLFYPQVGRGVVGYGTINDSNEKLSIPELQEILDYQQKPVSAQVEAHWPNNTPPEKPLFCGSRYSFYPNNGTIQSNASVMSDNSEVGTGTVLHPNVCISNSVIGNNCEVRNSSIIVNSRLGNLCLIGVCANLQGQNLTNYIAVDDLALLSAPQEPLVQFDSQQ